MKAPDELKESVLVIQRQLARERPCPRSPPPPWLSSGNTPSTSPSARTTEEVEKMEPDKPVVNTLVTKEQPDLERPRPGRPAPPWPSRGKITESNRAEQAHGPGLRHVSSYQPPSL